MSEISNDGYEMDWKSEITTEPKSNLLSEGLADFEVVGFKKRVSEKKKCNMAELTLKVTRDKQTVYVYDYLFLAQDSMYRIAEFFESIGAKKKGEKYSPDWNITGKKGQCDIFMSKYTKENKIYVVNKVKKYLEAAVLAAPAPRKKIDF